jgi:hypothetical protein
MKPYPAIHVSSEGFRVGSAESRLVSWSSIRRISTYKIDLVTTDDIRLLIEYDAALAVMEVELSEEQPGFHQLKSAVENHFDFPIGWWEAVMKPPFEANQSVLYVRAEQPAGDPRARD